MGAALEQGHLAESSRTAAVPLQPEAELLARIEPLYRGQRRIVNSFLQVGTLPAACCRLMITNSAGLSGANPI